MSLSSRPAVAVVLRADMRAIAARYMASRARYYRAPELRDAARACAAVLKAATDDTVTLSGTEALVLLGCTYRISAGAPSRGELADTITAIRTQLEPLV